MILATILLMGMQEPQVGRKAEKPTMTLFRDTNEIRKANGVGELRVNEKLMKAAQEMAEDIAKSGRMSHRDSQNRSISQRVDAVGYDWRNICENLAYNFKTPKETNQAWMESTGHRKNLLDKKVTEVGFGLWYDSEGSPYWVAIYAAPMKR
jgi:uncharacterized protein YkwD